MIPFSSSRLNTELQKCKINHLNDVHLNKFDGFLTLAAVGETRLKPLHQKDRRYNPSRSMHCYVQKVGGWMCVFH